MLERATRLVLESGRPIADVADDLGLRQVKANDGRRSDLLTSEEREEIRKLRKESFELRRANEILKSASVFFARWYDGSCHPWESLSAYSLIG